ncbi:MAG: dihydrolipoamide acetyltransferase family protein [Gammaproteobacteria bacterium]
MTTDIRMPRIGQSMTEGVIVEWLVAPGTSVAAGDALLTVETDKTTFEVEAPAAGTLGGTLAAPGDTLEVGAVLGHLLAAGEATPAADAAPSVVRPEERVVPSAAEAGVAAARPARAPVSPKARRLASEHGLDPAALTGSGPDGLVTAEDVEAAIAAQAAHPAPPRANVEHWHGRTVRERVALSPLERATARHTHEAWLNAPHFVQMVDADMGAVKRLRAQWKRDGDARAIVTVGDFCVAATARALAEHPHLNAAVDGDSRVCFEGVDIGIAVDTPRGLVVPVLRDAANLDLLAIATRTRELAAAARDGRLSPTDVEGGSATVSNLGAFGIRAGTPVLNTPQPVLVFVGALEDRAVVRDGALAIAPMMTLSVAYDHRVADGARAAVLTVRIRELLEAGDASA